MYKSVNDYCVAAVFGIKLGAAAVFKKLLRFVKTCFKTAAKTDKTVAGRLAFSRSKDR